MKRYFSSFGMKIHAAFLLFLGISFAMDHPG